MYTKSIYSIIVLIIVLVSCQEIQFTPTEINKIDIKMPEAQNYELIFEDSVDTLVLWTGKTLNYEITPKTNNKLQVEFYIDDQLRDETDNSEYITFEGDYWLKYTAIPGLHLLKVLLYVSTGSGSIADRLFSEFYYSEDYWPIYIDNRSMGNLDIINFNLIDSNLKITWEAFPFYNFQEYRLYKASYTTNVGYRDTLLSVISQKDHNYLIDSTYNGNSKFYRVDLLAKNIIFTGDYINSP